MTDCENGEIRDLLPAWAHGQSAAAEHARVEEHLSLCLSCQAEVALLRTVVASFDAATPRLDMDAIVRALPAGGLRVVPRSAQAPRARYWMAAAASVLVVGTVSLAGLRGVFGTTAPTVDQFALDSVGQEVGPGQAAAVAAPASTSGLSVVGGVSDLSNDNLNALLVELETISPTIDAEPASLRRPLIENEGAF